MPTVLSVSLWLVRPTANTHTHTHTSAYQVSTHRCTTFHTAIINLRHALTIANMFIKHDRHVVGTTKCLTDRHTQLPQIMFTHCKEPPLCHRAGCHQAQDSASRRGATMHRTLPPGRVPPGTGLCHQAGCHQAQPETCTHR
jgi:hypothetical protein